jgi:uncharacterized protein with FMN-binding domain
MRRIVTAILSTITALVLLFSYHTSTNSTTVSPVVQLGTASGPTSQSRSPNRSGSPAPGQNPPAAGNPPASSSATFTGGIADTQWGPVQVQITVQSGKVTQSRAVQYPQNNDRDAMINGYALPILDQEVVQQQSAAIDTVSGATVTSDGYLQSLQSAIDQAHL